MDKYIPNPTNASFNEYVAQIRIDLPDLEFNIIAKEEDWWEFARQFVSTNNLELQIPLPNKDTYPNIEDWRKWFKFIVLSGVGFIFP